MPDTNGSVYFESPIQHDHIANLTEKLEDDFVEVEDFRTDDRRVWVSLDHVEAIAVDRGKLINWRFPHGNYTHLKNTLMNRFLKPEPATE